MSPKIAMRGRVWLPVALGLLCGWSLGIDDLADRLPDLPRVGLGGALVVNVLLGVGIAAMIAWFPRPLLVTRVVVVVAALSVHLFSKSLLLGSRALLDGLELPETILEVLLLMLVLGLGDHLLRDRQARTMAAQVLKDRGLQEEKAEAVMAAARRSGRPLGIVALAVFDHQGRELGTPELKAMLSPVLRLRTDLMVWWPGLDATVLACPDTSETGLRRMSERLREHASAVGSHLRVGFAVFPSDGVDFGRLAALAARRLNQPEADQAWSAAV